MKPVSILNIQHLLSRAYFVEAAGIVVEERFGRTLADVVESDESSCWASLPLVFGLRVVNLENEPRVVFQGNIELANRSVPGCCAGEGISETSERTIKTTFA